MTTTERWEPGDIALTGDGALVCRANTASVSSGWPWAYVTGYVAVRAVTETAPDGGLAEADVKRPLTLLVRDGHACSGITDDQGDPCPVWAVKASLASLESQLTDVAGEYRELVSRLGTAVGELVVAGLRVMSAIPDGEIRRGCVVSDGKVVRERFRAAVLELIRLKDGVTKR